MLFIFLSTLAFSIRPRMPRLPEKFKPPQNEADKCDLCFDFADIIIPIVSTVTEEEINYRILNYCKDLPDLDKLSCLFVDYYYFEKMYAMAQNGKNRNQICGELLQCNKVSSRSRPSKSISVKKGGDMDPCPACASVVDIMVSLVDKATEEEISEKCIEYCNTIESPEENIMCLSMIYFYFNKFLRMVNEGKDHEYICKDVLKCDHFNKKPMSRFPRKTVKVFNQHSRSSLTKKDDESDPCPTCADIVDIIVPLVNVETDEYIEERCVEYCSKISDFKLQLMCDTMLLFYIKRFLLLAKEGKDHTQICKEVLQCDHFNKMKNPQQPRLPASVSSNRYRKSLNRINPNKDLDPCPMCADVVDIIVQFYGTLTEEAIGEKCVAYCDPIKDPEDKLLCEGMLLFHFKHFYRMVGEGKDHEAICKERLKCDHFNHLKRNQRQSMKPRKNQFLLRVNKVMANKNDVDPCALCKELGEAILPFYDTMIEEELDSIVIKKCLLWPEPYCQICEAIAFQYVPIFVNGFKEGKTTLEICIEEQTCDP
ncbi:hypothetical protein TRFO_29478 [Tritrichomonas foetus]|uniref:Saposin B-type domain-containing protein n=1 Tax=Tritrichomonas foetus TaxID=1144522 RepID=A0A1J4JVR8_9EUKA|nr:hypothetical protein TRFO_29478 [Tritrichomonas foetus]|eukprot:OHT03223.1 hypothetical protein TRFO_29478 [Tritrichomonas foetus]